MDNINGRYPSPNGPGAIHEITYGGQVMYVPLPAIAQIRNLPLIS